jgi:hypothetical protein
MTEYDSFSLFRTITLHLHLSLASIHSLFIDFLFGFVDLLVEIISEKYFIYSDDNLSAAAFISELISTELAVSTKSGN